MKKIVLFFALIISVSVIAQQKNQRFAIKSGYIKYEHTGNTVGTEELWWDDYGNKTCTLEKTVTTTKIFGMKTVDEVHTLEIIVKDKFWTINYADNTATSGDIAFYDASHEIVNELSEKEQEELAQQIFESFGGEKEGKEAIKGYTCDVYSLLGVKSWIYKGIMLKTEGNVLGFKTNTVFSDFKPNSKVTESKFSPPSDVSFSTISTENLFVDEQVATYDEPEVDSENELAPISYDFEKFKAGVMPVKELGYKSINIVSDQESYVATFMKGFGGMLSIGATADIDNTDEDILNAESFTHKGHTCWYNETDGGMLIVHYKSQKMYIIIVSPLGGSKASLLEINDKLSF